MLANTVRAEIWRQGLAACAASCPAAGRARRQVDAGDDGDGGDAARHLDTVRAEIRRQGLAACARKVVASCTRRRPASLPSALAPTHAAARVASGGFRDSFPREKSSFNLRNVVVSGVTKRCG